MSVEIEKKYRLSPKRRDQIIAELQSLATSYHGEDLEENVIFGGDRLSSGSIVRIRKTEDRTLLTFKRRIGDASDAKHQLEYETEVSSADAIEQIVRELGLHPRTIYEKRRMTWHIRNAELVIDELPFGLYMEIEGSLTEIREVELLLGLDDLEIEHETYPRLTTRLGHNRDGVIEARFQRTD